MGNEGDPPAQVPHAGGKRMRLRYAGRCRLCGTPLAAGADAVYEPGRRSVRCVACPTSADAVAHAPDAAVGTARPASAAPPRESPAPASSPEDGSPPAAAAPAIARDALRLRAPASSVISETLRVQGMSPPQSRAERLFGRDPLAAEAVPWFLGALGELEVARVLDRLGDGWHVVHAIPVGDRGSDIDHLVIGPPGVFTINAKRHPGKVWVANRTLMVNGQRTHHVRNAEFEAGRVAKALSAMVTPLVVIVGARRITIRERPQNVVVLHSGDLVRWLSRSAPTLTPAQVTELAVRAVDPATWGATAVEDADLSAFAALRESMAQAARRRAAWLAGLLAAGVTAPVVLLPLAFGILQSVGR